MEFIVPEEPGDREVEAGFAALMEHDPSGAWKQKIPLDDWDKLDMVSESRCVLGWVFGDFTAGMCALFPEVRDFITDDQEGQLITWQVAAEYGFAMHPHLNSGELAAAWRRKLTV